MAQLTKGARAALEAIADDLADLRDRANLISARVKSNPDFARDKASQQLDYIAHIERVLRDEIAPLLQRQAPSIEQRLDEMERRLRQLEDGRIVVLRKEA
jgi:hypothetical protein